MTDPVDSPDRRKLFRIAGAGAAGCAAVKR